MGDAPEHPASPLVWQALLDAGMPQTALMRLPRLTRLGLLGATGPNAAAVVAQLTDRERLRRARVHPLAVLVALRTYASGRSVTGTATWEPVGAISDALDAAFYAAFGAVEPTDRRTLLALDVSGSMGSPIAGLPLSCRDASTALAMVIAAVEPSHVVVGSTGGGGFFRRGGTSVKELDVTPRRRLDDVVRAVSKLPFGATDCSLPMQWALENDVEVDTFQVLTDNETWHGEIHPHQALVTYRERTGIAARLAVVAMSATRFSMADPSDPGMLDVVGFDTATPQVLSDFSRGTV